MKTEYLTKQLNGLIHEMVDCDLEKYISDMFIYSAHTVFIFKKNTPKRLIKYMQCIYKNRITPSIEDGIWRIVF